MDATHSSMQVVAVILLALPAALATTTCSVAATDPCVMTMCPDTTTTCVPSTANPDGVCCPNANVVPGSSTPATNTPSGSASTAVSSTCADSVNPSTGVSQCASTAHLCNNSLYFDLMTKQCPKTCGRCAVATTASPSTCVDKVNPATGVSECPRQSSLCNKSNYYKLMTEQCPKTCGRCTGIATTASSSTCVDTINSKTGVSDCPRQASLCNIAIYYKLMTQQCPKTCGRCSK